MSAPAPVPWTKPCATQVPASPNEVRIIFAHASAFVWAAPCGPAASTCRHRALWAAVLEGLRGCQLGVWDQAAQRRLIEPLAEPYDQALPGVQTDRLLVNRLTSPLIAAADAARSGSCVAPKPAASSTCC